MAPPGKKAQAGEIPGDLLARLFVELLLEAILEFGADLGNFHSRAHEELAAQQFMRLFFIRQFSGHAAILTILIPAEASVGYRFRADVLKTTKNRIFLRDFERLAQDLDGNQAFVGTKYLRANHICYLRLTGL